MSEPVTVEEFDKECNKGLAKLDKLRAEGKASTPEYSELLYRLRDLTHKRLQAAGIESVSLK